MANLQFFAPLLSALWLRPESALWYSQLLQAARSFGAHELPRPNLDFGCMDGLNSYIMLGGEPPFPFDVFELASVDPAMHHRTTLNDDYYDVPLASSFWDFPLVNYPFDIGVDWKQSHIDRARQFGAHRDFLLIGQDGSMSGIPANSVMGIWAPNLYWMRNVDQVLSEFRRVVRAEGKIITIVPDRALLGTLVNRHNSQLSGEWLASLDRGRYQNASRSAQSLEAWLQTFERSNLSVLRNSTFLPATISHIYEIGFRPMFGPLLAMRRSLMLASPEAFLEVKREWVSRISELLDLLWSETVEIEGDNTHLWHIFELAPRTKSG